MQIAERGPRQIGWAIVWTIMVLLSLGTLALGLAAGVWYLALLGLVVGVLTAIRLWGALTGARRVIRPAKVTPISSAE